MTQYDMIYDLVTDPRFADRVGTVFTERGNIDSGASYRELMETFFPDDTSLEQALSSLMMKNQTGYTLWCNTNWFNFLKKMYYYNQDKEQKVDILFTDLPIWNFNHRKPDRDKIMADNIISTVKKEHLKKSLTIMNSKSAYLVKDDENKNCGYYIAEAFPDKVANVLINTTADNKKPLQRGKWDVAFEQMPEDEFAFHLSNSPFGKDNFDLYTSSNSLSGQTYEEMFTGVIFYKPLYKHLFSHGFPYMMQSANMEILKERVARFRLPFHENYYRSLGDGRLQNCKETYFIRNLFDNCFFIWNLIVGIGMLLYLGIVYRKSEKREHSGT